MRDLCACGHQSIQHPDHPISDRPCEACLCPSFHDTPRMVRTILNGRDVLSLPSHRAYLTAWRDGWEVARIESMRGRLGRGDIVYDVGAEQGDMPALWASWGCDVVPVEPNPKVWPSIRACFEANDLRPPSAYWVGFASDQDRWPDAYDPGVARDGWPACAFDTLDPTAGFAHLSQQGDTIPQVTLDSLANRSGLMPSALTIDVEGAELRVLKGATMILDRGRPWVWVSIHQDRQWMSEQYPGEGEVAVRSFMRDLDYWPERLGRDHELHLLFTPRERLEST
jgi:FkbM family methyltransferase